MTTSPFATHLAAEVRAELARQKVTTAKAASAAGCSAQHLYRRLGGHAEFTASELYAVAAVLGISASDLVERVEARVADMAVA